MSKKNKNVLILVYVAAFLMMFIGTTFAFFTIIKVSNVSAEIDAASATMPSIVYNAGEPIAIYASPQNFAEGMGNLSGSTVASARLKNGSQSSEASFHYNISLELDHNTMVYSDSRTPELVLSIVDPNNREVKSIAGLDYVTVDGVSGFDITDKVGLFNIHQNYEISTKTEIVQEWKVTLTFVNLQHSQDVNMGNGLSGSLKIDPV